MKNLRNIKALIALVALVIACSCKSKKIIGSEAWEKGELQITDIVDLMTIQDNKTFMVLKSERDYVESCLALGSSPECCLMEPKSIYRVEKRAPMLRIVPTIPGDFMLKFNIGINPEGKVAMVRLATHSQGKTDDRYYHVGVVLFNMEFEADENAPCLRFTTYTVNKTGG